MKKINILLMICLLAAGSTWAQNESESDTTRIKIGDLSVIVVDNDNKDNDDENEDPDGFSSKEELTHWGGIDLGVNLLMNKDGDIDLGDENAWLDLNYARSLSWNINMFETKIRIASDYVGIITGLGLSYNSYGLADSVSVANKFDVLTFDDQGELLSTITIDSTNGVFNSGVEYTKNKFRTTQLRVPVMIEFNTSRDNDRSFHLAAGVIGGWRFSNVTKQKYSVEGIEHKDRTKGDYNTNDFTLDATVRVGFQNYTLYANYALTPLFKDGKGPEVYPLSVGISLIPW